MTGTAWPQKATLLLAVRTSFRMTYGSEENSSYNSANETSSKRPCFSTHPAQMNRGHLHVGMLRNPICSSQHTLPRPTLLDRVMYRHVSFTVQTMWEEGWAAPQPFQAREPKETKGSSR